MTRPVEPRKKPYTPPRLRRYGDLRTLTGGARKTKVEAGVKTKATGGG
ncbi:MAG: lasso RiPP family leader peptide-containing protein [Candidatus Rokubacteria bacterium]|nr:lasso RiPP family leader peptide-containing protein [Candidatus Rokubacteria bacterium]